MSAEEAWHIVDIPLHPNGVQWGRGQGSVYEPCLYKPCFVYRGIIWLEKVSSLLYFYIISFLLFIHRIHIKLLLE